MVIGRSSMRRKAAKAWAIAVRYVDSDNIVVLFSSPLLRASRRMTKCPLKSSRKRAPA